MVNSMMKPSSDATEIVTELKQIRPYNINCALLILEGTTDRAFWNKLTREGCGLVPAGNKETAVNALVMANSIESLPGVAAVIDPDTWLLEKAVKLETQNLLFDDTPDIELMLLKSPALENALYNALSGHPPEDVCKFASVLRTLSIRLAADYGYFRLLHNRRPRYGLRIKKVGKCLDQFIDTVTLKLDNESVAAALVEPLKKISQAKLLEHVRRLRHCIPLRLELCRGKDALLIMAHVLEALVRQHFADEYVLDELTSLFHIHECGHRIDLVLRMNYDTSYFLETCLYRRMHKWERENPEFLMVERYPLQTI